MNRGCPLTAENRIYPFARVGKLFIFKNVSVFSISKKVRQYSLAGFIFLFCPLLSFCQLSAGTIAATQCINSGAVPNPFTSVAASGSGYSIVGYSWESSPDSVSANFSAVSGSSGLFALGNDTYAPPATSSVTYYRRKVLAQLISDGSLITQYSNKIYIGINPTFTPTVPPYPIICQGTLSFPVNYTTTNSPDAYTILWDATAVSVGFTNVADASLAASPGSFNVAVPSNVAAGTYNGTLSVKVTSTGCASPFTSSSVLINPLPTVTATPTASAITIGMSTTLTGAGSDTYAWTPSGSLSSSTGSSVTATPLITTMYTATGTVSATGCVNTGSVTITVNPVLTAGSIGSNQTICSGLTPSTLSSTALPTGGTGSYIYQWQKSTTSAVAGFADIAGATSTTYAPPALTTTTYYRRNVSTGIDAIISSNAATLTVNPLPTITTTPTASAITVGMSTTLTAAGSDTYAWTPSGSLSSSTGSSVTATPLITTMYTATGTVSATGCVNTGSVTITVNPVLTAGSIGSNQTICSGLTPSTLSSATSATGGTGSYIYQWQKSTTSAVAGFADIAGASSTTYAPPALTTTTYYRRNVSTGIDAIISSNAATLTVNPLPTVTVSPTVTAFTTGMSTTLSGGGAVSYSWSPSTSLSATTGSSVTASPTSTITYTVTGTDANSCINTANSVITVNPAFTAGSIGSNQTICSGLTPSTLSSTTSATGGTGSYIYQWQKSTTSAVAGFADIAGASSTTYAPPALTTTTYYRRNVSTGIDAIIASNAATLTVNPLPVVTVNPSSVAITSGTTTTLTASGANTYTWTPAIALSTVTGVSVSASPTTSVTYTVTGTDINGCISTATSALTVNGTINAGTIASNQTICSNTIPAAITSTSLASGGTGTISYQWQQSTDNIIFTDITGATSANYLPAVLTQNRYYRRGAKTAVDAFAYTSSVSITIQSSVGGTTNGAATVCANTNSTTLSVSGNTGVVTKWQSSTVSDFSSLVTDIANTTTGLLATNLITTTYYRAVVQLGSCTSVNSSVATVIVNALPATPVISGITSFCSGASTTLTSSAATGNVWSTGATTQTISVNNGGNYRVTVTDANGCSATSSNTTVTVNALPATPVISGITSFCSGGSTTLTSSAATGNVWSNGASTQTISVNSGGNYRVTVTDANSCSATSSNTTVTVNALPETPVISGITSFCSGASTILTSSAATGNVWSNGATTQTISVNSGGNYGVTVTDANGCSAIAAAKTVTLNPLPILTITHPAVVCMPGTVDLTLPAITAGSSALQGFTYFTDAATTQILSTPSAVATAATYYIKGTLPTGCSAVQPVTVSINAQPAINITNPATVCAPATVNLAAAEIVKGSTAGLVYTYWTDAANTSPLPNAAAVAVSGTYYIKGTMATGCSASLPVRVTVDALPTGILQNPAVNFICEGTPLQLTTVSNASRFQWYLNQTAVPLATDASYNATVAGNYTVQFISAGGCIKDAGTIIRLDLIQKPKLIFTAAASCAGAITSFNNQSSFSASGGISWLWDFGDGSSSNSFSPVHTFTTAATYPVSLTANNASCVSLTEKITLPLVIEAPRAATRYATVAAIAGKTFVLNARSFGVAYLWQPPVGLSNATSSSPSAILSKDTTYTVRITTAAGCSTTDTVLVKVTTEGEIFMPQGFSPNGDGVNDRLYPDLVAIQKLNYYKIFNRWGNLVFITNDPTPQNGWNGKFNGVLQPSGAYSWIAEGVDAAGNLIRRNGTVLLIN